VDACGSTALAIAVACHMTLSRSDTGTMHDPLPIVAAHLAVLPDGGLFVVDKNATGTLLSVATGEVLCRQAVRNGEVVVISYGSDVMSAAVVARLSATGVDFRLGESWGRQDGSGMTSLMFAAVLGDVDVTVDLLERGVSIDDRDEEGWSALMHACRTGKLAIVELLLAAGARHEFADDFGSTALIEAARHGHGAIVSALVRAGADVDAAMDGSGTARALAAAAGHTEIALSLPDERRSGVRLAGDRGALEVSDGGVTFQARLLSRRVRVGLMLAVLSVSTALAAFVAWDRAASVLLMATIVYGVLRLVVDSVRLVVGPAGVVYRPNRSSVLQISWGELLEIWISADGRTTVGFVTASAPVFTAGRLAGRPIARSRAAGRTPDGRWVTNVPLRLFCRPAVMTALAHRTLGTGVHRPQSLDGWL
jgi:hypothetical protein